MAIEAKLSKHKKTTFILYMVFCLGMGAYFAYDGYKNEEFITKHTVDGDGKPAVDGKPDSTLVANQKLPFLLVPVGIGFGVYLLLIRNRKVVADEKNLTVGGKVIDFDAIEKIDKTFFESKGYFVVTYKDPAGAEKNIKLSDRNYDDLELVLEHLVAKIS